jgi:hypothetical protein
MKRIAYSLILICFAAFIVSCSGKENSTASAKTPYESEISLLKSMTTALLDYKKAVTLNPDVAQLTKANMELLAQVKKLSPQIETLAKSNPEWENNPPPEVGDYVLQYMTVNEEFTKASLKAASMFVDKHSGDKALVDSFQNLKAFLMPK